MARMAPENIVPVVEMPSSEEYGNSEEIDPISRANAAARISEFVSASEGVLEAGPSEGPHHGVDRAIIQSGVPSNFARAKREEGNAWWAHIAIGAQIEENLSRALGLFSQVNFNVNNVSVLFARFRFHVHNSHSCFFICGSCCTCRGTRASG